MTFGSPDSAATHSQRIPSIVIVGSDALIAALPATPIQLAHACALAGYQHVVPVSWGDELIAAATLHALRDRAATPAIQCSCPFVAHRLLAVGTDLRPFLISLVAPPVVLARYLRAAHGMRKLRITYVGRCPGAADEAIDARLTPEELLAIFADHQIKLEEQPQVFESVIPPDRRRFHSQPGGLPTPEMLWSLDADRGSARTLVELFGDELPVELAQHLLAGRSVLIDVAPKLGCVCSGAASGADPREARARVAELEPPRAATPVIDESISIDATLPLPASPRSAIDVVSPPASRPAPSAHIATPNGFTSSDESGNGSHSTHAVASDLKHPAAFGRRHSPSHGIARPISGGLPTARDAGGRQLPRTYVARRRLPARVTRNTPADAVTTISSDREAVEGGTALVSPNDANTAMPVTPTAPPAEERASASVPATTPPGASSAPSMLDASAVSAPASVSTRSPAAPVASEGGPSTQDEPSLRRQSTDSARWVPDAAPEIASRFAERSVALPVTPLSDGRPREESAHNVSGDRPVVQVLTLGLLIAMIVLVSAAVGVLVGRWMSQR